MTRIAWLDTDTERDVPHVISDAVDVSSYVTKGKRKDEPYGYRASTVLRRATLEDIEAWREGR